MQLLAFIFEQPSYFSIFVKKDFQCFLKFSWQGQLYTFVCVLFGYSLAPRLFTKILKPIYAWFRCQGFRCSYYIDDSINMDKDKSACQKNALVMTETLESLGFFSKHRKICSRTQTEDCIFWLHFFSQSDASLMGWVAYNVSENVTSGGRWILSEAGFCINYLEL